MTANVDTAAKPAPPKRRKRLKRKPRDEPICYLIRVTDWDCFYGFRVSDPNSRFNTGPYSDIATVAFKGDLVEPKDFKYRRGELTLSAREDMAGERWTEPPKSVGSLSAYDDTLAGYVFVPAEHMAILVALASSGKVQTASIIGSRLRYRSGSIQNISLDTSLEDEDEQE
ncbi:MAG: hypothetical protein HQ495_02370 [Alphaproteobacteria bacterium]|nr:hypothetical protein [Alphaproteobacteria bacterium]